MLITALLSTVLSFAVCSTELQQDDTSMVVEKLTENIIMVSGEFGYDEIYAINTDKGIVVIDSLWSTEAAAKHREAIEETFGKSDFAYVIFLSERMDFTGSSGAFPEATVIGHETFLEPEIQSEERFEAYKRWVEEKYSGMAEDAKIEAEQMSKDDPQYKIIVGWGKFCEWKASSMQDYVLTLPDITFKDELNLDMGNVTIKLIYFGKTSQYKGNVTVLIPEEKCLIAGTLNMAHYLSPPMGSFLDDVDIQRWLDVYDYLLNDVDLKVITSADGLPWTRERFRIRPEYFKTIWERVNDYVKQGLSLADINDKLSFDGEFSYLKELPLFTDPNEIGGFTAEDFRGIHYSTIRRVYYEVVPLTAKVVFKTLEESGLEAAVEKYRELRQDTAYYSDADTLYEAGDRLMRSDRVAEATEFFKMCFEQNPAERVYNGIGYSYLGKGLIAAAIEAFEAGIKAYPQAANLYDSLGEAYMTGGNKELAIKNYRKSLEINPENQNAKQMLEKLEKMEQ